MKTNTKQYFFPRHDVLSIEKTADGAGLIIKKGNSYRLAKKAITATIPVLILLWIILFSFAYEHSSFFLLLIPAVIVVWLIKFDEFTSISSSSYDTIHIENGALKLTSKEQGYYSRPSKSISIRRLNCKINNVAVKIYFKHDLKVVILLHTTNDEQRQLINSMFPKAPISPIVIQQASSDKIAIKYPTKKAMVAEQTTVRSIGVDKRLTPYTIQRKDGKIEVRPKPIFMPDLSAMIIDARENKLIVKRSLLIGKTYDLRKIEKITFESKKATGKNDGNTILTYLYAYFSNNHKATLFSAKVVCFTDDDLMISHINDSMKSLCELVVSSRTP